MHSWPTPAVPEIPGSGGPLRVYDTATGALVQLDPGPVAGLYVCGITPYDATHLGHAATYVTFDILGRVLRDAGHAVRYVQNVTDVDEPLLERAARDGYLGVTESIDAIVAAVARLEGDGTAYRVDAPDAAGADVYLDISRCPGFGSVSGLGRDEMLELFAERGGDPDRAGKRDALDPLLWRAEREGEPAWEGARTWPSRTTR